MFVQIEYYDSDILTNLISIVSMKPDKVIFIYDKDVFSQKSVENVCRASQQHLKDLQYEIYSVDSDNLDEICNLTQKVVPLSDKCIIDLTGGSDLMTIAGYKIGQRLELQMIYADIRKNKILDVIQDNEICDATILTIEDYLTAKGAAFVGNSHLGPKREQYNNILRMANYIFRNLNKWKKTCVYTQTQLGGRTSLRFYNRRQVISNRQKISPDLDLLRYSENQGFIKNLTISNNIVSYLYTTELAKQYMTTYGIWLELYVYLQALQIKGITDVHLGAMIDWDAHDGIKNIGNEIDVIISKDSRPIFISCKLTQANTATLNEINVAMRRCGGSKGKGILVTFSDTKRERCNLPERARELGIRVLDQSDILSGEFGDRLNRVVDELLRKDVGV